MWHSVISASGISIRYNPLIQILGFRCAKDVPMKLIKSSDSYDIVVRLLPLNESLTSLPPQTPPVRKIGNLKAKDVLDPLFALKIP